MCTCVCAQECASVYACVRACVSVQTEQPLALKPPLCKNLPEECMLDRCKRLSDGYAGLSPGSKHSALRVEHI